MDLLIERSTWWNMKKRLGPGESEAAGDAEAVEGGELEGGN